MKEKKNIFLGLLIAASLLLTTGCPTPVDGGNGGGGTPPTAVTFVSAVAADGADGTENTTELTLTFSVDPTTLTADNITVTGATKGALSGSGTTRSLAISDITVANGSLVFIEISSPSGFTIKGSPKAVVVYKDTRTAITFESAEQTGGTSGTADSTGLTLTFSVDPTTLTADDITLTGATKGALSGTGTTRTLAISNITVGNGETVSLTIANPSGFTISGSPQTAVVYTDTTIPPTAVTFESAVQTGGTSGTADSTGLTLTFSVDPTTLTADNITVTGATKGALSGSGLTRTLAISNITVGNGENVTVAIANPSGFTLTGSPQTAVVYKDTRTAITFESAVAADGADGTANTTELTLTFSVDPTTLAASDITLSGATKGALSGSGLTRTLAISNITVANGATVSVEIANPRGFTISGSPKTAVVYKDPRVRVTYNAGTGNTSGTVPEDTTAYDVGSTVTVLGDPGDLKGEVIYGTTHMQLLGWNTQANGEGTMYYDGNTFTITEDTTLYAIYTALRVEGPAGGLIFYDAGSAQSWGRYLEASPQSTEWASKQWGKYGTLVSGTGTAIGTGKANTDLIVAKLNEAPADSDRAAQLADALSHGGYEDWFLPSKDELDEMCWVLYSRRWNGSSAEDNPAYGTNRVGGFAEGSYWSSSEYVSVSAWYQHFGSGYQGANFDKTLNNRVRSVRAF